jgi:hypothetical protein
MPDFRLPFMRCALLLMAAALTSLAAAQGRFTVNGRLKADGGDLSGARAVVYKNGVKERTIASGLSKFTLDLELNASYVVSFEKEGFVSKKLSFDTHVPGEAVAQGFTPFDFAVSLFKQYEGVSIVVFNQPVGMIRYDAVAGDFDYDTDYTKSIQSQMQEVAAQVERKQKEEQQKAAAEEKRKAEEAKAQAKAAAEAVRQAVAQQAAEAKARAEAEKQAAAQQAAEAKARAEAEKQAAAQQAAEAKAKADAERKAALQAQVERQQSEARARAEAKRPAAAPPARAPISHAQGVAPAAAPQPVAEKRAAIERAAPTPRTAKQTSLAQAVEGHEQRRTNQPVAGEEPVPKRNARNGADQDLLPAQADADQEVERSQEVVAEGNKVTTVITVRRGATVTEYRRVSHKWGGVYYFKQGLPTTQMVYEREAVGEQLAGAAAPRAKHE